MKTCIAVTFMMLSLGGVLLAQDKPKIQRSGESDFTVILTKMRFTTLILLPVGEEIADVICGDKDYWVIEGRENIVYVKPAKEGARTNVNIVSKNKVVYSFLVQEITKPGNRDKPDLKVVLGEDELVRAKRDNEKLTADLAKALRKTEDPEAKAELEKKRTKDEAVPVQSIPSVAEPAAKDRRANVSDVKPVVARGPVVEAPKETKAPPPAAAPVVEQEKPLVTAIVIGRNEGLIRKSGRALGRFLQKISQALHLY